MARPHLLLVSLLPASLGLLALLPWAASTGEYHYQGTLLCYDCHTMHYSQTHNWDGTTPVPTTGNANGNWLGSGGPFQYLLKSGSASSPINDLCLACHDGQTFAPDVLAANTNSYVRQAGALNRMGGAAPYQNWKGHTLDMTATPPGGTSTITINCLQCHNEHGSASYRNLTGAVTITYTKGEPYASRTKTVDVWLKQWVQGDLTGNYSYNSVRFNERYTTQSTYAVFCQGCHTVLHGLVGDPFTVGGGSSGGFIRHPNAGASIGAIPDGQHSSIAQYNAAQARVHVMSNSSTDYFANPGAGTFTVADGLTPSCFSCHKAHGNQNPFGLIFLDPTSTIVTEEGSPAGSTSTGAGLRNLCSQCHTQAD